MKTKQFLSLLVASLLLTTTGEATPVSTVPPHPLRTVHHHSEPALPSQRQVHELDEALEQFRYGHESRKPGLRARGLDHAVRLLVEMKRHGVKLRFNPMKYGNEEIARLFEKQVRVEKIGFNKSVVVRKLRTCFFVAHLACGYDFHDPANSNITDLTELERPGPMSPFQPRLRPIHL